MALTDKAENRDREPTDPKDCLEEKVQKTKPENNKTNLWGNQPRKYSRTNTQEIGNERSCAYSYKAYYIK